jgi:hypothetical protein
MTNYEYLQNISLPKLAAILGYIADTNPCCPLKKLGKCKYITESELNYDCCESWCDYLMDESTETDRKFWSDESVYSPCTACRLAARSVSRSGSQIREGQEKTDDYRKKYDSALRTAARELKEACDAIYAAIRCSTKK